MFHTSSDYFKRLLTLLDLLVGAFIYLVILDIHPIIRPLADADYSAHVGLLIVILAIFGVTLYWSDRKPTLNSFSISGQLWLLLQSLLITFVLTVSFIFFLKLEFVSRVILVGFFASLPVALIIIHVWLVWLYYEKTQQDHDGYLNVLIVGSGRRARMLAGHLQNRMEWGVSIVGFLDPTGESAGRRKDDEILGNITQISEVLRNNVVDEVIVAVPRGMIGGVQAISNACEEEGVTLSFMADFYDFKAARVRLVMVSRVPLLTFEPVAMSENALIAKRIVDLVVTIAALPLLIPVFAIVAIAIKLDSPGPVFFLQSRVGLHKRQFQMMKFRSMVEDAEVRMKDVEHLNEANGPNFKIAKDPRVTRLGSFLRNSSIDELPQLINVLKGDMSLVGPRPMSLRDVDLFDRGIQRRRFSARPGLTCLWQISGRSDLDFDDWLALDLQYIDNWSFWKDLQILIMTVPAVIRGSGAV